ncbi:hypothetical protein ACJRO7_003350 [Eucalyptus globulus]|uniref:Uncharacterized protein n=1 Tax=Eucalyptus globulus TaxID=34317 RepID=A0ABD3IVE7_EUCGL
MKSTAVHETMSRFVAFFHELIDEVSVYQEDPYIRMNVKSNDSRDGTKEDETDEKSSSSLKKWRDVVNDEFHTESGAGLMDSLCEKESSHASFQLMRKD